MNKWWTLAVATALCCTGCVPVNPSAANAVGKWKVSWTCGVETLELKSDGTYAYAIDFEGGGRATDAGRWTMVAKSERLKGAEVLLLNALDPCDSFGDRIDKPGRADRNLETIWEWGRMTLSFSPDTQGFKRM